MYFYLLINLHHAGFGHEVYADAAYGFYFHHNAFVAVDSFYDSFHVFEGTGGYFYFAVYFSYKFFGFQISKFFFWTTGNLMKFSICLSGTVIISQPEFFWFNVLRVM